MVLPAQKGELVVTAETGEPGEDRTIAELWVEAAHDLIQPVQAGLLLAKTLDGLSSWAVVSSIARQIEAALELLREMLEILTLLSRIEAGQRSVQLRTCELGDVLKSPIKDLAAIAAARGIRLQLRNLRGLVRTNPKLCVAATRSLLINAIEFCEGSEIFAGCRRSGSQVMLEVRFRGASFDTTSPKSAFVRLSPRRSAPIPGELALGFRLLGHLCRLLGHSLQFTSLVPGQHLLVMGLPLASKSS